MQDLSGKSALITGAGTGIGRATAIRFAEVGCNVLICGRREAPLQEVANIHPERISWVQADVSSEADRTAALKAVIERHGQLDILVNNAAITQGAMFEDCTREQISQILNVNLLSTMFLIHEALPHLKLSRGCIVNVSSASTLYRGTPSARVVPYAVAKEGVNQLTRSLAGEFGQYGIRINAVSPGTITETDMVAEASAEGLQWITNFTPLGRLGNPGDIAAAVCFLAGNEARWVTGEVLQVSGGLWL